MANPHKGESRFSVGEKEFTLRLTNNVRCELEKMLGDGIPAILSRWSEGKWTDTELRAMFWGALKTRHQRVSLQEAGELIDEAGAAVVVGAIAEAYLASQPSASGNADGNPPQGSGTGSGS
jgi:hypothetical protein